MSILVNMQSFYGHEFREMRSAGQEDEDDEDDGEFQEEQEVDEEEENYDEEIDLNAPDELEPEPPGDEDKQQEVLKGGEQIQP